MSNGYRIRFGTTAVLMVMVLSVLAAVACSNSNDETVQLLEDPKIGLSHRNDEFHTIKGEELLTSPTFGLAHLNDEFHAIKETLADPKFGLAHLNDEFHTIKQTLAELSQKLEALQARSQ